jgi:RNA polymerase sigma-70 factor (ECF subfamily)
MSFRKPLNVSRNIAAFKTGAEHGSFKAWLQQQTRWRIADQFRKRGKSTQPPCHAHTSGSRSGGASDDTTGTAAVNRIPDPTTLEVQSWDAEWERHLLKVALDRLRARTNAKQFQMFDLHALQGMTAKEAARTLGSSVMAVHMATSRVRRLLRKEFIRIQGATY